MCIFLFSVFVLFCIIHVFSSMLVACWPFATYFNYIKINNMQYYKTAPDTALVTGETTHRLHACRFDLQGETEWKSIVSVTLVTMRHLVH